MKTQVTILSLFVAFLAWDASAGIGGCIDAAREPFQRRQLLNSNFKVKNSTIRLAFFDADATLRETESFAHFPMSTDDIKIMSYRGAKISDLNRQGYLVVIVSNQGGLAEGPDGIRFQERLFTKTIDLLQAEGGVVDYFDFAENFDSYRKPGLGMAKTLFNEIRAKYGPNVKIDMANSFMVGDAAYTAKDRRPDGRMGTDHSNGDRLFAENLGIRFYEPNEFFLPLEN